MDSEVIEVSICLNFGVQHSITHQSLPITLGSKQNTWYADESESVSRSPVGCQDPLLSFFWHTTPNMGGAAVWPLFTGSLPSFPYLEDGLYFLSWPQVSPLHIYLCNDIAAASKKIKATENTHAAGMCSHQLWMINLYTRNTSKCGTTEQYFHINLLR